MNFDRQLALTALSDDSFEAFPEGSGFLFGGHTMGLLMRAGEATVRADMVPKSMHTYFLRPGRTEQAVQLDIRRLTDGRSFAVRQVTLTQAAKVLAVATASFHMPGAGADWQVAPPGGRLPAPAPEDLAPHDVTLPEPKLIEVRPVRPDLPDAVDDDAAASGERAGTPTTSLHPYWARATSPLDAPELHFVGLAYASDYLVIRSVLAADVEIDSPYSVRTLDHALWFHRPFDFRDWHLFTAEPQTITDGRGLSRGSVRSRSGDLVASFDQEVIIPA